MTWHRIDDPENPAPKDGTGVLAYARGCFGVAKWVHKFGCVPSWDWPFPLLPTHWQPLPNPPEKERT